MNAMMVASRTKAVPPVVSSIQDIPIVKIRESKTNPRRFFDEAKLAELAGFVPGNKIRVMLLFRASEIMETRTSDTRRDIERQFGDEIVKVDADCSFADAARFRKGEQRCIRFARVTVDLLDIAAEALSEFWSKGNDPTLPEFGFPDEKCIASEIDVAQIQAHNLANA